MSFLIITIGFMLSISANWSYSYFGLSSFEQIVYHIKVPLEGTNTQFIFDWFKKCGLPAIIFGLCLCWIPKIFSYIILILCIVYGLYKICFFQYVYNQFKQTDFYNQYFKEIEYSSPENKKNLRKTS